jgi:hypothetical protein
MLHRGLGAIIKRENNLDLILAKRDQEPCPQHVFVLDGLHYVDGLQYVPQFVSL